jgi:hypothetical protein
MWTSRCGGTPTMSSPSRRMLPPETARSPEMVLSVVDLPAPLPPMRVTISPSSTVSEMPFRASTLP